MSSTAKACFLWSVLCLGAFLASNVIWSQTSERLRAVGGVEVAPNVTLLQGGKLHRELAETHGWPLAFRFQRTLLSDGPGTAGVESESQFRSVPLALDMAFFIVLLVLLVSLFGMRRPERFSWQLVALWCLCIAALAGIGLAPPRTFL